LTNRKLLTYLLKPMKKDISLSNVQERFHQRVENAHQSYLTELEEKKLKEKLSEEVFIAPFADSLVGEK